MNKQAAYSFIGGMNQDVTKSKSNNQYYFEGNNIRITSTDSQSTYSVTNEKGNELVLSIPTPSINHSTSKITYGNKSLTYMKKVGNEIDNMFTGKLSGEQIIIGNIDSRDGIILFTTDDNGFDCIWEATGDLLELNLLYIRNLGFSSKNPIQALYNFENEKIQKVYWVDGVNQLRFLNIKHSVVNDNLDNLIDVNSNTINIVGTFKISQPIISDVVSGGTHTAGKIQYAYNLYRLNSSQTKLSPLTPLIPLDKGKGQGGGDVNEIVGSTPIVNINNIDPEYTHIKVYAVKYTSYNQIPTVSLIKDQEINSTRSISIFDDGTVLHDISLAEFLFLGTDPIIPKHIESKDNYLISANIREKAFDVDLDARAYSFNSNKESRIYDNVRLEYKEVTSTIPSLIRIEQPIRVDERGNRFLDDGLYPTENFEESTKTTTEVKAVVLGEGYPVNKTTYNVPEKIDTINIDYDTYKYQSDGVTLGGEGKYLKYELIQDTEVTNPDTKRFFKDNEIYRLGIHFYNRLGQKSLPKWIADFRAPEGNLENNFNTLRVTLKPEFFVWLNDSSNFESEDDRPVGYKILRANRTHNDRTVISQGFLNGMMSNYRTSSKSSEHSKEARHNSKKGNKLPSLQRTFAQHHTQMRGMEHNLKLDDTREHINDDMREVHKASSRQNWVAETFQYNILMQMFTPDVMFGNVALYEGLKLKVKGALKNNSTQFWGQTRLHATKEINREGKVLNGLTPHEDITNDNTGETTISGEINHMCDLGIFGPAGRDEESEMDFYQFYRDFTGGYVKGNGKTYSVYGKPDLTEKGQGKTNYNGDPNFEFYNTLQPMITDGGDGRGENSPAITSVNSWGAPCITMVLGPNDRNYSPDDRPRLEKLWRESGVPESNIMLVAELVKNNEQIYLGGIYGGNSYEDKKRTNYIEIGDYAKIDTVTVYITSPGDTFVHNFRFSKIVKTDTEVYASSSLQLTEIVEGVIETDIDLRNRNDISFAGWDARFQPRYDEFHKYNRVYSQHSTLVQNQDEDYTFRRVKNFDTRIIASKVKIPGENIDSWTDILVNETLDLNGKNGPINAIVSFKDEIYALQNNALAAIGINPRVQVQGGDGIAIELGSGSVLHDYKYVTTMSGSVNKWGVVVSDKAIYYLDVMNSSLCRFAGRVDKISDVYGMHSWFQNNLRHSDLKIDNPILGTGVTMVYDIINNDIITSLHQPGLNTTLVFNESVNQGQGGFTSFMDYCPSRYMYYDNKLYSLDHTNRNIYQHHIGRYNQFYGQYYPSHITLSVNPDVFNECVYNNIYFNSELYLDGKDQFDKTLTHIQTYNEYQDSGLVPLVFGRDKNLRRKFRSWRADIPRQGRQRIRNPWMYLKLVLDNEENYKLILHDVIVDYTAS